jgi:hypothetical protein
MCTASASGNIGRDDSLGWMVVGREATASVWRARDELRDRDVAVKQFHKSHPHEVVEARIAARARHPSQRCHSPAADRRIPILELDGVQQLDGSFGRLMITAYWSR